MFLGFFYALRSAGIQVSTNEILQFYRAPEKVSIESADSLFLLLRLICVHRKEDLAVFEKVFLAWFFDREIPLMAENDLSVLDLPAFRNWLREARLAGEVPFRMHDLDLQSLIKKFWDTLKEQTAEHHGGAKWIGTGGNSPFGHSGNSANGVRMHGNAGNFSALKVIAERRYIAYSDKSTLSHDNLRQTLSLLKNLQKHESHTELDIAETVYRSGKEGDIVLEFAAMKADKLKCMLFIDNGGSSMQPHVALTRLLFSKMQAQFKSLQTYFFHNTVYSHVYRDDMRTERVPVQQLLKEDPETRVFIVGDASMAASELFSRFGNINYGEEDYEPSVTWLRLLRKQFSHSVWLNPVPENYWPGAYTPHTINSIRAIFRMYAMDMAGIRQAIEFLN